MLDPRSAQAVAGVAAIRQDAAGRWRVALLVGVLIHLAVAIVVDFIADFLRLAGHWTLRQAIVGPSVAVVVELVTGLGLGAHLAGALAPYAIGTRELPVTT